MLPLIHRRLQQQAKDSTNHVVELEQSRETQDPVEHPTVGTIWADDPTVSPEVVGAIITQVQNAAGPLLRGGQDRNQCGCTEEQHGVHGICVWLQPLQQHQNGFGRLPHLPPPP